MMRRLIATTILGCLLVGGCTDDGNDDEPRSADATPGATPTTPSPTAAAQPSLILTGDVSASAAEIVAHGGKPVSSGPACTVAQSTLVMDVGFRSGTTTYYLRVTADPFEGNYMEFGQPGLVVALGTAHGRADFTAPDALGAGAITITGPTVVVDGELRGGGKTLRILATVLCPELG